LEYNKKKLDPHHKLGVTNLTCNNRVSLESLQLFTARRINLMSTQYQPGKLLLLAEKRIQKQRKFEVVWPIPP
jgi:hypothetical protein